MNPVRKVIKLTEEIESLRRRMQYLEWEREKLCRLLAKSPLSSTGKSDGIEEPAENLKGMFSKMSSEFGDADSTSADIILDVIKEAGEVDAKQLSELAGITFDGARLRLARYSKKGLLARISRGKYKYIASDQNSENEEAEAAEEETAKRA